MFHFILTIAIVWLAYKTATRGFTDNQDAGVIAGIVFGVIAGFSFLVGGWWSLIGYAIFVFVLASWIHNRRTIPADIEQTLAEYEAMKPELEEQRAYAMSVLHPKRPRLPG